MFNIDSGFEIIEEIAVTSDSSNLVAMLNVRIEPLIVYGIRILRGQDGKDWVSWPRVKKATGDHYFNVVEIADKVLERRIKDEIIRQYYLLKNQADSIPPMPQPLVSEPPSPMNWGTDPWE